METLTTWWDALDGAMKFFYAIAFSSTAVLSIQTLLTLIGFDGDHGDQGGMGVDHDHSAGDADVQILSVRTIVAFLVGFGWVGAIFRDFGWMLIFVFPIALVAGLILMFVVFYFMKLMHGLRASGSLNFVNAIGEVGTVYLPIAPNREKHGQVEVMIQGRLMVVDAFTSAEERLENRTQVRVIDTVGENALLVIPDELSAV
ncbi:MAG: hypothetical protein AAGD22_14660 [Verrucomicrobiota bacterium]